jgi:hypothetical protein
MSQKTTFFIVTAVKPADLTREYQNTWWPNGDRHCVRSGHHSALSRQNDTLSSATVELCNHTAQPPRPAALQIQFLHVS